jgi:hypothetical protein
MFEVPHHHTMQISSMHLILHTLGLWRPEYFCEDFSFTDINHTDGFLGKSTCFTTT